MRAMALALVLGACASAERDVRVEVPKFRCTGEEGYWQGRAGLAYTGWCTPDTATAFLERHQRGRELYELYRRRAVLEQEVSRSGDTRQVEAAAQQIAQIEALVRRLQRSGDRPEK